MPLLIGIPLALVGGTIHVACIVAVLLLSGQDRILSDMLAVSNMLAAAALFSGVARAIPITMVLLPLIYYLSRHRIPVRLGIYALVGLVLGVLMLFVPQVLLVWHIGAMPKIAPPDPTLVSVLIGQDIGTLIAAMALGLLFGYLMQGHYARYRLKQEETR